MAAHKKQTPKDPNMILAGLMVFAEQQAEIAHCINAIATAVLKNKAIYESDILELLTKMQQLEQVTADALKEVSRDGNSQQ